MAYAESIPCGERKQLQFWRASKVMDLDVLLVTLLANGFFFGKAYLSQVWPSAAIRAVAAPQVAYLSARLGFTLRDDTMIPYPTL